MPLLTIDTLCCAGQVIWESWVCEIVHLFLSFDLFIEWLFIDLILFDWQLIDRAQKRNKENMDRVHIRFSEDEWTIQNELHHQWSQAETFMTLSQVIINRV